MVIDSQHMKMLNRNLLYTGITRAKKAITIIGQQSDFKKALSTAESSKRISNLAVLLRMREC